MTVAATFWVEIEARIDNIVPQRYWRGAKESKARDPRNREVALELLHGSSIVGDLQRLGWRRSLVLAEHVGRLPRRASCRHAPLLGELRLRLDREAICGTSRSSAASRPSTSAAYASRNGPSTSSAAAMKQVR